MVDGGRAVRSRWPVRVTLHVLGSHLTLLYPILLVDPARALPRGPEHRISWQKTMISATGPADLGSEAGETCRVPPRGAGKPQELAVWESIVYLFSAQS